MARTLDSYIGMEPFTVKVDDSERLRVLAGKARSLRSLEFPNRLEAVKQMAINSMKNAYEQMVLLGRKIRKSKYMEEKHQRLKDIVFSEHPLSYALEQGAGCCRHQGALFFSLAYEADLGDKHLIQSARVNERVMTVFNQIWENSHLHNISIFIESLQNPDDPEVNYTLRKPDIFETPIKSFPGVNFCSYYRKENRLRIIESPGNHVEI